MHIVTDTFSRWQSRLPHAKPAGMITKPRPFLLRHRDFGLYWGGMTFESVAVQIESVTIGWQVYTIARQSLDINQSAFMVGMVGLAQFLPLFVLTLWAGSLADRAAPL